MSLRDVHILSASRDIVGEGLFWSVREQAIYWVDIFGQKLKRLTLEPGQIDHWAMPEQIGWVIERENDPGLIAGLGAQIVELDLAPFAIRPIVSIAAGKPEVRLNDAKADCSGRIWAGTMPISVGGPQGALYRLDPDRRITCADTGYAGTNGPAFSADGRIMYHSDTPLGTVYRFAVADDGSLGDRAIHIQFPNEWGLPDGMTVDAEGGLWIAHWGGGRVSCFDPCGNMIRSIALPASQITNCAFFGPQLDRMVVTSASYRINDEPLAGALFEIDPRVSGFAPFRYSG